MTRASNSGSEIDADAARAQKIIGSLPGHAWSADAAGRFTYVAPNTLAFLGSGSADLDPVPGGDEFGWRRVVHPDDYERVAASWRHCLRSGDHYDTEHRLRRADGAYRWFRNSARAEHDTQGRITQWYGTTIDIEAQKQVEAQLRDRERELSQLVDMVPSHVWRLRPDGEPTFFNKRMVDFLGLDVADTDKPGMTRLAAMIEAAVHPDDAAAFAAALRCCLLTGERFSMRYRLRRADHVYRWMSSRAEPMRDQSGRIVQWYGLCHDIDDQMHAEQALRRSERQLQQMIDAVPVRIWSATSTGGPLYFNKRYQDHLRSVLANFEAIEELGIERVLEELVHPDDAPEVQRTLATCFETGDGAAMRFRWCEKTGGYRWVECRLEARRDQDGSIVEWYGVSLDIDDQVRAHEALHDRERELSQLVNMVPSLLWRLSPEGEPIFFSKRLIDYFGPDVVDADEPGTSRLAAIIRAAAHPDDAASLGEALQHSFVSGEPFSMKYRLRRSDGAYRWMLGRAEPLRDEAGRILQWYGLAHDIDDQVHAEEALRHASDRLARATQAASLAELSAAIAHEMNQPLAAVATNSHACQRWLAAEPPNIERAQKAVERIVRDTNDAADVVSRIRALFKQTIEGRGRSTLAPAMAEVQRLLADLAVKNRVNIEASVDADLPAISLDRVQIQQVLMNLMRNAMEAMEASTGTRALRVHAHKRGEVVQVEVRDNGPGIAHPEKIFDSFFTTKESGMGMGLAISRSIVESHGGRLWAEGNEHGGSTFIFTMPVEPPNRHEHERP